MKVILIKDVPKVGRAYEIKNLADGFARNLIIARGLGVAATAENLKKFEAERVKRELQGKVQTELLEKSLKQLAETTIKISAKASETGHLFAGLHQRDILAALKKQTNLDLPESMLMLDEPIKTLGEFVLQLKTGPLLGQFRVLIERSPS